MASHDEDTTSLAVEAGRRALTGSPPAGVVFATARPAYLDKTNATAVYAALGLDRSGFAYDMVGSVRSGVGALRAALDAGAQGRPTMAVLSDVRIGLPGSHDEANGGDGAAAFVCGEGPGVVAELVGAGSATAEFLDRWRSAGEGASQVWEERFGEAAYVPLGEVAIGDACKDAGVLLDDVDHVLVVGPNDRACRRLRAGLGRPAEGEDVATAIGNAGCALGGIVLADALDRAEPEDLILLMTLADGADALLFRATPALSARRQAGSTIRDQLAGPTLPVDYATFLTWRGLLRREPPRRPDPDRPAAPPSYRRQSWKFGLTGSRCRACGTRQLPPSRTCVACRSVDEMEAERLAEVGGSVATFTVDRLAYSLSPPVVVAVVDLDGGGRIECEMTDVAPDAVAIGDRVEMTFRRLFTADGVHNYFWKARPVAGAGEPAREGEH